MTTTRTARAKAPKPLKSCFVWGKADFRDTTRHSALPAHMLAVAATFDVLLELPQAQRALKTAWGIEKLPMALLVWCAAMHDIGKCKAQFQAKRWKILQWISKQQGKRTPAKPADVDSFDHAIEGGAELMEPIIDAMVRRRRMPGGRQQRRVVRGLLMASFAHHGEHDDGRRALAASQKRSNTDVPVELAGTLLRILQTLHSENGKEIPEPRQPVAVAHLFAGWVALADWIGSDERTFPFIDCMRFSKEYPNGETWNFLYRVYRKNAEKRIKALGLDAVANLDRWPLAAMGKFKKNEVQRAMQVVTASISNTFTCAKDGALIILEAPMGSGKTEAALLAAGELVQAGQAQGIVFALPAQASANMVYRRLGDFTAKVFRKTANLAHGQAKVARNSFAVSYVGDEIGQEAAAHLDAWLTDNNKRAFLAPVCAATVDQVELAAMHSKHGFVRFAALSRHVVIIDEVHAYDAYMQRILQALLQCLGAAAVPTILLSATLPVYIRASLTDAYATGARWAELKKDGVALNTYPLVTTATSDMGVKGWKVPWNSVPKKIQIARCNDDNWCDKVLKAARAGQCVAVLCNTRRSARMRYEELRRRGRRVPVKLLHSTLRVNDRLEIQTAIEDALGRDSGVAERHGQVVIATQVLEQSIDIDVDFMLSEPAPIDLLLQRMGRLHRHERPYRKLKPHFMVIDPMDYEAGPRWWFGSKAVYAEGNKLVPSLLKMRELSGVHGAGVTLPTDIPQLVADVYGESEEVDLTIEQDDLQALAGNRVIELGNAMDNVIGMSELSNATRNITELSIKLLMVVEDLVDGGWSIPTAKGLIKLPPLVSADGARVNAEMLEVAQQWTLGLQGAEPMDEMEAAMAPQRRVNRASEAEQRFLRSPALRAMREKDWRGQGKAGNVDYPAPFVLVPVKVIKADGQHLVLDVCIDGFGEQILYDNLQGLKDA